MGIATVFDFDVQAGCDFRSWSMSPASGLILLRVHPRLDPIRQDPRYWELVTRVGLAEAP